MLSVSIFRLRQYAAALLFAALLAWWRVADPYGHDLLAQIAILVLLCLAIDFAAGYGGMVSLGHAALAGLAAYAFAGAAAFWGWSVAASAVFGIFCSGAAALAVGWAAGRAHGVFFIMISFAFGQIAYETIFRSRALGGDDGFAAPRADLSTWGVDLFDAATFSLACLCVAAIVYVVLAVVAASPFGRALVGVRENEARMAAMGLPVREHRAAAFGLSGLVAGVSGVMAAQHTLFITPELLDWTASGEALVATLLGGLGGLAGAAMGGAALVLLRDELSAVTDYWEAFLGVVLILAVLGGGRGILGVLDRLAAAPTRAGRAGARDAVD